MRPSQDIQSARGSRADIYDSKIPPWNFTGRVISRSAEFAEYLRLYKDSLSLSLAGSRSRRPTRRIRPPARDVYNRLFICGGTAVAFAVVIER